jgi:protein kinase-like protein
MTDDLDRLQAALADRYVLERELGRGGMATVWLARDLPHERKVAIKVLRPELAASMGPERFQREIRTTARLQHPHILPVLDSGDAAGQLWYTTPYVRGEIAPRPSRTGGRAPGGRRYPKSCGTSLERSTTRTATAWYTAMSSRRTCCCRRAAPWSQRQRADSGATPRSAKGPGAFLTGPLKSLRPNASRPRPPRCRSAGPQV